VNRADPFFIRSRLKTAQHAVTDPYADRSKYGDIGDHH